MEGTIIDQIRECIQWLHENNKSKHIVKISQCLNKLATLTITLSDDVYEAYKLQSDLEDIYDDKLADRLVQLAKDGVSAAASKPQAQSELKADKANFTAAKNGFKKLAMFQERVDKVMDTYKQYVSNLKDERNHSKGQI